MCLDHIFLSVLPLPFPPEGVELQGKITLIKWCGLVNNPALRSASGSNLRWPRDLRFQTPQASRSVPSHTGPPPFLSNSAPILWVKQLCLLRSSDVKHVVGLRPGRVFHLSRAPTERELMATMSFLLTTTPGGTRTLPVCILYP